MSVSAVQNNQVANAISSQEAPKAVDQNTRNKTCSVAMKVLKVVAAVAFVAAAVVLGHSHNVAPLLKKAAPFVAGCAGLFLLASIPTDGSKRSEKEENEWKKDARNDRENALKEQIASKKKEEIKKTSTEWHGGNNSNYVPVGSRKV